MQNNKTKPLVLFVLSLVLILLGSYFAKVYHTSNGNVQVREISFFTSDGAMLRGLLYIPNSASPESLLPAVVGAHGYNNTAELQGLNAIELSRRGIIVLTVDEYGHGKSSFPAENVNKGIASDNGIFAALQYLKTLPYVDLNRVGVVGHSMGGSSIQIAALKAWKLHETDPSIVVPTAVLPTSQSFMLDANNEPALKDYPVNIGAVYGRYDEWAKGMWGVDKGSDARLTNRTAAVMGFANPNYDELYQYGNPEPIKKEQAVEAAKTGTLRVLYQPQVVHPRVHMSSVAGKDIIEFFDITLLDGKATIPAEQQIWHMKEFFTGIAYIGYFLFIAALGLLLLKTSYFKTLIRKEPISPSDPKTSSQKLIYWVIFIACLLPAPLVYNWLTGYPIDIKSMGRTVPTLFPANAVFPMPTANGLVLFNLVVGGIMLIVFLLTYFLYMKKNKITIDNLGVKLPICEIGKSLLLAFTVFMASYCMLLIVEFFFTVDFRWYVLSIKSLTAPKIKMFLVYLPFWAFAFLISSLTLNSFTRMQNKSELYNILLMMFASVGGLLIFWAIDYGMLLTTGVKWITTVPYPKGTTSALAGVLLWGLLFILPVSAVISRIFFKATGSIWVGGFINSFVVTLFAISNTVIAAGVL